MRKFLGGLIKGAFRQGGFEICRIRPKPKNSLAELLRQYQVEMVFDVGANAGMSGNYFRGIGYDKTIVSFEPVRHLFGSLKQNSGNDSNWFCENVALVY